jgi:ABC-type sugar transport system ATPase subunit
LASRICGCHSKCYQQCDRFTIIKKGLVVGSGKKGSRKGISDLASSMLEEQNQYMHPAFFISVAALDWHLMQWYRIVL